MKSRTKGWFRIRSCVSHEALRIAMLIAPTPYIRLWLDRGLAVAGESMREEIRTGTPVDRVEVDFNPHDIEIPRDD